MNLQSLVVVVLRLASLDFVLRVFVEITPRILRWLGALAPYQPTPFESAPMLQPWLVVACLVASALALWVLAPAIARLVTGHGQFDFTLWTLSLADCYSVAFLGVGLLYALNGLPQVLNWGHYFFKAAASGLREPTGQQVNYYQVSQAFIPFIAGVVLIAKGRVWALVLARRDSQPEFPNLPVAPKEVAEEAPQEPHQ